MGYSHPRTKKTRKSRLPSFVITAHNFLLIHNNYFVVCVSVRTISYYSCLL